MTFVDYIIENTIIEKNNISNLYRCKLSGLLFSWEDSDKHFDYLKRKKLI